jgi:hypothetical protein
MSKKNNSNEDDDKNKKGKNSKPNRHIIRRGKSLKSSKKQTSQSKKPNTVKKSNSKSVQSPKKVNNRNTTLILNKVSDREIEFKKVKTIKKKVIKVNKLKPYQLTSSINKKDSGLRRQIISLYEDKKREKYMREEILKMNRMKSVFKILEKIGKKFSNVEVKSPKGGFKYPDNTSYRISIHQLLLEGSKYDYVEGVIYSKKDHIMKPHSWNVINNQHVDYSLKNDKGDFIYYGVVIPRDELISFLQEVFPKKLKKVNESILELCTVKRGSKVKVGQNSNRVLNEITNLRKKFIPQTVFNR